jgi:diacylglycerol kinase family enzyme
MRTALLIANPASSGFSRPLHRKVAARLARTHDVIEAWPSSADNAREITGKAVADGVEMVIAMGGDGIIHHVAQSMVGSDTVLGIVPSGTANVLARQLGIPVRAPGAAKVLAQPHDVVKVPVLEVTGTGPHGAIHRYAVFSFGVGADADIVQAAEAEPHRKRDLGPLHYAAVAVSMVRKDIGRRTAELRIDSGQHSTLGIGAMAQFRQSYTYFGRAPMRLSPFEPNPVTLLVVEQLRARRALAMIRATIGKRGLETLRGFEVWPDVTEFTVSSGGPTTIQADGEVLGSVTTVTARFLPHALSVAVPPS